MPLPSNKHIFYPAVHANTKWQQHLLMNSAVEPVDIALVPGIAWFYSSQGDLDNTRQLLSTIGNGVTVNTSSITNAGMGLYVTRAFSAGTLITEYDGVRLTMKQCHNKNSSQQTHIRSLQRGYSCIDGIRYNEFIEGRGGGSFINDPVNFAASTPDEIVRDDKMLNVDFVKLQLKKDDRPTFERIPYDRIAIAIVATRNISEGEELFISYGSDTWVRFLEDEEENN